MDGSTRQAIEHGQIFLSAIDTSGRRAPVLFIVGSLDSVVSSRLIHVVACTVLGAGSRLAHHLSQTVAIEVIDHELRVVGTGTDVHAEVDAPQLRTVELIAVDKDIVGLVAL